MTTAVGPSIPASSGQWLAVVVLAAISAVVLFAGDWIIDWYANTYRGEGGVNERVANWMPRWWLSAAAPFGFFASVLTYVERAETCGFVSATSPLSGLALFGGSALILAGFAVLFVRHRSANALMRRLVGNDVAGRRAVRSARHNARMLSGALLAPGVVLVIAGGW